MTGHLATAAVNLLSDIPAWPNNPPCCPPRSAPPREGVGPAHRRQRQRARRSPLPIIPSLSPVLTDDERDELVSLSRATVASDRYPLSPRIRRAQGRAGEARPSAAGSRTVTAAEALSSAECVTVKKAAAIRVRGEEVSAEIDIWRAAN